MSKEILTIREAVWLTDNTYKYEDLVRMMGEVVSVLEGKIRVSTSNFQTWHPLKVFVGVVNHNFKYDFTLVPHAAGLWRGSAVSAPPGEEDHSPL